MTGLPLPACLELWCRWSEAHRHYHGPTHLVAGLRALDVLGAGPLERVAFWFHDAVHSNTTPEDEVRSAALVGVVVGRSMPRRCVEEVQRLVLLTATHSPVAGDDAGARVCDADLAGLAAPWYLYARNTAGIRAELPHLNDEAWRAGRAAFLDRFLTRPRIYSTTMARDAWEAPARRNLERELATLQ